jgi:hypothetical protein
MYSDRDTHCWVGCPIRISMDQRLLAAPHGFSQRATSFIASWCQGIHRTPFSCSQTRGFSGSRPQSPSCTGTIQPFPRTIEPIPDPMPPCHACCENNTHRRTDAPSSTSIAIPSSEPQARRPKSIKRNRLYASEHPRLRGLGISIPPPVRHAADARRCAKP